MTAKPRVPAAALLLTRVHAGELEVVCVHRRAGERFDADLWGVPAARCGEERPAATARRCAREQTGLEPSAEPLPAGRWLELPFRPQRLETQVFLAPAAGEPSPGGDVDAAAWLRPADLLRRWAEAGADLDAGPLQALRALARLASADTAAPTPAEQVAAIQAALPADGELHALERTPAVRIIPLRTPTLPPATHTNCVVVGAGEAVVIDPASPYPDELARLDAWLDALAAAGTRVREILLTHHHPDHTGGVTHLAERLGVPVAAHPTTRAKLAGQVAVTRDLVDGERIELPGPPARRLRTILCEGHADGHLAFHEEVTDTLIAGDMVAGTGTIVIAPPEGKLGLYLRSLEALAALDARRLIPSHGPMIGDPRGLLEQYVTHRGWRERKVQDALAKAQAAPLSALVPLVYDDVPPHVYPLAERSLLAHLLKLEEDGAAACRDDVWRPVYG